MRLVVIYVDDILMTTFFPSKSSEILSNWETQIWQVHYVSFSYLVFFSNDESHVQYNHLKNTYTYTENSLYGTNKFLVKLNIFVRIWTY